MPLGNRMLHLEMTYLLKSSSLALHRKGLFCIWVPQLNLYSLFLRHSTVQAFFHTELPQYLLPGLKQILLQAKPNKS